jgi:glycerol kinase
VNNLLMQFQADMLGVPVVRPQVTETTALGAAYLAGLATGYWESVEEIERIWLPEKTFAPVADASEMEKRYAGWKRAVERSRAWEQE